MTHLQKKQFFNNPFEEILINLGINSKKVTLDYLKELAQICFRYGLHLPTYGSVFDMLRFLEERGCIKITTLETEEYEITGIYNYGRQI